MSVLPTVDERLLPELGVRSLAALRAVSSRHAILLARTWRRVQTRCEIGAWLDAGVLDSSLGAERCEALRTEADHRHR